MKLEVRYPTVLGTSIVAGVFSLIVSLLLILDFVGRGSFELFDSPEYLELMAQMRRATRPMTAYSGSRPFEKK